MGSKALGPEGQWSCAWRLGSRTKKQYRDRALAWENQQGSEASAEDYREMKMQESQSVVHQETANMWKEARDGV